MTDSVNYVVLLRIDSAFVAQNVALALHSKAVTAVSSAVAAAVPAVAAGTAVVTAVAAVVIAVVAATVVAVVGAAAVAGADDDNDVSQQLADCAVIWIIIKHCNNVLFLVFSLSYVFTTKQ